jgi:BirA family biotin operon repressor/biotin-[acetyl-CoA-carboxylase] ligase
MRIQTEGEDVSSLDWLGGEALHEGLETDFVGRHLHFLPEVGSTNDELRRLARDGAPEGTAVVTDYQSSGRGRLGRQWVAPPRSSLLISLLFRPPLAPPQVQRLTMIAGLAVADAVESGTGLCVGLKWPNDVILGGAKAGGMLTEIALDGQRVEYAVVGIGLNVNLDPGQLPRELLMPATSLSHELGRHVERLPLLCGLLQAIETRYLALKAGHSPCAEWAERLVTLGQPVVVSTAVSTIEGVAEGVTGDGALLVRLSDGHLESVMAGDVTLRQ